MRYFRVGRLAAERRNAAPIAKKKPPKPAATKLATAPPHTSPPPKVAATTVLPPTLEFEVMEHGKRLMATDDVGNHPGWLVKVRGGIPENPAIAQNDRVVAVGLKNGYVALLKTTSGKQARRISLGKLETADGLVLAGDLLIATQGSRITAHNLETGEQVWETNLSKREACGQVSPVVSQANGLVYIPSGNGNIYALKIESGKKVWAFRGGAGKQIVQLTLLEEGRHSGLFLAYQKSLYGFKPEDGRELWSHKYREEGQVLSGFELIPSRPSPTPEYYIVSADISFGGPITFKAHDGYALYGEVDY
ncbi:MAG: PQQ-binding-like beta-propeller repeat protein [bacterium]